MSTENKRVSKSKLSDHFRLVVIDDDTLKEVRSTRFSLINLIIVLTASVIFIMAMTFCLFAFTPLRYIIPGYADIKNNIVYVELSDKIEALEKDISAQRVYTEGFKNFLNPTGTKIEGISEPEFIKEQNTERILNFSNPKLPLEHLYLDSPLKGELSAKFDAEKAHYGVDIVAPKNTPILNILDGVVVNADWSDKTGHTISIQHSANLISIFKHNSSLLKKTGDRVKKGEAIAIIGNTGELSSGPHVHFELWHNGAPVDPLTYINFE